MWHVVLILLSVFNESYCGYTKKHCTDEQECKDLGNRCQCYCSRACAFRDKIKYGDDKDNPVHVPNDPLGKFCYCKERDYVEANKGRCAAGEIAPRKYVDYIKNQKAIKKEK